MLADHVYRGQPADPIRIRGVFVQSGELNIELIELISDAPSAFHDMFGGATREGLHHSALFAADYDGTGVGLAIVQQVAERHGIEAPRNRELVEGIRRRGA